MLPLEKCQLLYNELDRGFDMIFSIGTTSVFPYIAQPVFDAKQRGVPTIEINPGRTEVSNFVDIKFTSGAADTLDCIWTSYRKTIDN